MEIVDYVSGANRIGNDVYLGTVYLKVRSLKAQVEFYKIALKMVVLDEGEDYALLGDQSGNPLLHLRLVKDGKRNERTSGLYHFALLYPSEKEFAKAVAWLMQIQYPNAPTDHGFSKTTYLKDLEGNDIELYIRTVDRADYIKVDGIYKVRYKDGRVTDGRDTLDLKELFGTLDQTDKLDTPLVNMKMGHVHLYGYNLETMNTFYTDVLGFAEGIKDPRFMMGDVGKSRSENHVIAFNAWRRTTTPASTSDLGLDYFTINFTEKETYDATLSRLMAAKVEVSEVGDGVTFYDPSHLKIKVQLVRSK